MHILCCLYVHWWLTWLIYQQMHRWDSHFICRKYCFFFFTCNYSQLQFTFANNIIGVVSWWWCVTRNYRDRCQRMLVMNCENKAKRSNICDLISSWMNAVLLGLSVPTATARTRRGQYGRSDRARGRRATWDDRPMEQFCLQPIRVQPGSCV